nr:hypothetical protein [Bacillota bacterium]
MDEICRTYGLRPIELVDKPVFDAAFASLTQPISDYTFAQTFIWRDGDKSAWTLIEGHVCVFANGEDLTLLLPPIGEGDLARCLKRCFEIMDDYNGRRGDRSRSRIEYTSDELLARMKGLGLEAAPMSGDYVYETARLIDLAGQDLKSKRHLRNRFLREHTAWTEPLRPEHVPQCLALLKAWHAEAEAHDTSGDPLIALRRRHDLKASEQALLHFASLNLTGMVLWADGRLVGFTLGQPLSPRQASIVIEKAERSCVGAAQYIFSEFCRQYWHAYPECNAGDDWEIPSLAWTKESYRPLYRLRKWVLRAAARPMVTHIPWSPPAPLLEPAPTPAPEPIGVAAHETAAGLTIEPGSLADVFAIAALEQRVFPPELAIKPKQVRYLLRSPRSVAVVARVGSAGAGTVAGWTVALVRKHRGRVSARLYSVAVDPEHRRQGLGEKLVRAVLNALEQLGIERCVLEVAEDNAAARQLYERLGFRYVRLLPDYYGPGRHGWRMARGAAATLSEKIAGGGQSPR